MTRTRAWYGVVAVAFAASLSGGGGGGGSAAAPAPAPPPAGAGALVWTPGVYQAASLYADRCEVVRTGADIEGNPFPDRAGSLLHENFWLRSWTDETYLWNTEVLDRNPAAFDDRLAFFALLRTTETTASGKDKDQFHFSQPTTEFLEQRNSAPRSGYGVSYAAFSTTVPRDFRVRYTEPNSPASAVVNGQVNMPRGARILEIDGVDLVNANTQAEIDILNNGLFPAMAGENHVFVLQDPGAAATRTVTLISADLAPKPVNRMGVVDTPSGRVGYLMITTFSPFAAERDIAEAITAMKAQAVSDLVVDLRYNGGGLLAVASQLGYMIAGAARTGGRTFELLEFNAAAGNVNPVTGEFNAPAPFYSTGLGFSLANGVMLDSLDLPRVFILSTASTCSASESVINSLRGVDVEVVLIGATTCGKPFGFYPEDNCGETYFTIQFRGVNDKGFGDYADGFTPADSADPFGVRTPGCAVADDLDHELGEANEALLAAALEYRATSACPSFAAQLAIARADEGVRRPGRVRASGLSPAETFWRNSRDMTMPY